MTKNNTQPTDTQIQVVMSDWLGTLRKGEDGNYTHKGKGGITRQRDESIFDYLIGSLDGLSQVEAIKKSRKAAENVANAIVSAPVKVVVGKSDSMHAVIGGRHHICLATDYFDDNELSARTKAEVMLGLAAHEGSHAEFTESDLTEEKLKQEPASTQALKKDIWNIIEDERIEYLLGDRHPGLVECLGTTKEYYYKRLVRRLRAGGKMPTEPIPKFISTLIQAVRYPSEMTREQVIDNFDELDRVRRILTPYPLTAEGAWDAAGRVMDVIRDMAKEEAKKRKQQEQQQEQQQGGGSGPDRQGQPQPDGGGEGQPQGPGQGGGQDGKNGRQKDPRSGGNGSESGKAQESAKQPTKQEIEKALSDMLSSNEAKKVLDAIRSDNDKASSGDCKEVKTDPADTKKDFINQDDSETVGGPGQGAGIYLYKPEGNRDAYLRAKRAVKAFIPAMSKALACRSGERDYVLQGMPGGKLNTNKLATFRTGNKNIFVKGGTTTCTTASVIMLIDESGSMSGSKLQAAREAAVLVKEAVDRIGNVTFYCYGYDSRRINVYVEPGVKKPWALGATRADGGTPTGMAMGVTARRVRTKDDSPCLMLVLTDGVAHDPDTVRMNVRQLPKAKIYPIGIGIQTNTVSDTFDECVIVNEMKEFPYDLGKLTKGRLSKMLVRHDMDE